MFRANCTDDSLSWTDRPVRAMLRVSPGVSVILPVEPSTDPADAEPWIADQVPPTSAAPHPEATVRPKSSEAA